MDLFAEKKIEIVEGAYLLREFALPFDQLIAGQIEQITAISPFRIMTTPNGYSMSVAMTNCGKAGWVTDKKGYRYQSTDPVTESAWPALPKLFTDLARSAADGAGFPGFSPDACLINQYRPGAKLSLHQDKDEMAHGHPVVSVSLGLPATFLFGGARRNDPVRRMTLDHGDVVVWGGPARMNYHGITPIKPGIHPMFGDTRINLTLRTAL